jgi:hypothetical protein
VATVGERLLEVVNRHPGETDRFFTDLLFDKNRHQAQINQEARLLERRGQVLRKKRPDGKIGNFPINEVDSVHSFRRQQTFAHPYRPK